MMTKLKRLQISNNDISDIGPVSGLTDLEWLLASNNQIGETNSLSGLTKLQILDLNLNNLTLLDGLSGLTQLRILYLGYNNIQNIHPLANLSNVETLLLQNNNINLVPDLAGLTSLKTLYFQYNYLYHSDVFEHLPNAELVNISYNSTLECYKQLQIEDWLGEDVVIKSADCVAPPSSDDDILISEINFVDTAFANCVQSMANSNGWTKANEVAALYCSNKGISNASGVEHFTNATFIDLSFNSLTQIPVLKGFEKLTRLRLTKNNINDVSSFADSELPVLDELSLFLNKVTDITPLANLTSLTWLAMSNNQITDVSAIASLTNLKNLSFGYNQVTDISVVGALTNLTHLTTSGNPISDISVIGSLTKLTDVHMKDSFITDLSVFNNPNTDSINRLSLANNGISDITPLFKYTNISYLALKDNFDIPCADIDYMRALIGNDLYYPGGCAQ